MANKSNVSKKKYNNLTWFANVGKSLGYASMDVINEMMPATMDTIVSSKEPLQDLSNKLKTIRGRKNARLDDILTGAAKDNYESIKKGISNTKEDLKSGNFYNKKRLADIGADDFDYSDFDFDDGDSSMSFSDDLDDDNFSDTSSDSSPSIVVPNINVSSNINANNPMVNVLKVQTDAIVDTSEASMEHNAQLAKVSNIVIRDLNKNVYDGLQSINSNVSLLVKFQSESTSKYYGAALSYFEQNIKVMTEFITDYRKINYPDKKDIKQEDSLKGIIGMSGGFDVGGYASIVKKQLGEYVDNDMILSSIKDIFTGTDDFANMMTSPLQFVTKSFVNKIVPEATKKIMGGLDKTFSSFIPAMLMKLNRYKDSENPLLSGISQIFGIKSDNKTSIDTSMFNKGPMPFNGVSQKYLTEVIPGYLSRILSALEGGQSVIYDPDTGKFTSYDKMQTDFTKRRDDQALSQYGSLNEIKSRVDAYQFTDPYQKDEILKKIDSLFLKITDKNHLINPFRESANGDDDLDDLLDGDSTTTNFIRGILKTFSNGDMVRTFGEDVLKARDSRTNYLRRIEAEGGSGVTSLFSDLYGDEELLRTQNINSDHGIAPKSKSSVFNKPDNYGYTQVSYLRDIKKILMKGINVFIAKKDRSSMYDGELGLMSSAEQKEKEEADKRNAPRERAEISEKHRRRLAEDGIDVVDDLYSINGSIEDHISEYVNRQQPRVQPKSGIGKKLRGMLSGAAADKYDEMLEKINAVFKKPADILKNAVKKVDDTMFEIVFGKDPASGEDGDRRSFFSSALDKLVTSLSDALNNIKEKFFDPLKEALLGEKGILTRIRDSNKWKDMKKYGTKAKNYLVGVKGEDGKREGGLFRDTANEVSDIFGQFKYYFTGKSYKDSKGKEYGENQDSVFGNVRGIFSGFKRNIKDFLFGEGKGFKDLRGKGEGVIGDITNNLKSGFQTFADAIFGPRTVNGKSNFGSQTIGSLTDKIKEKAPKALAIGTIGAGAGALFSGQLGILGSLLLPGGPIGAAIVGTTIGFLSQSDRFKNWLFGEKDPDNNRIGGFINKATQDFFKKNKTGLIAGGAFGALKGMLGFGLLPGFILGGPVGGAIMGMGVQMGLRSETFQKTLFGNLDSDGNRSGGFFNKIFSRTNDAETKKRMGVIGAGALGGLGIGTILSQFGFLGALAFGPFTGAIAGAVAGISLTSDKWKNALFGKFDTDEDGEVYRQGGLFNKFGNLLQVEILQPLKVKMMETKFSFQNWFSEKIAEPVLDSIDPIKRELIYFKDKITQVFVNIKESILNSPFVKGTQEFLIDPIMEGFKEYVFNPFKEAANKVYDMGRKIAGTVIGAPFKLLNKIADRLAKKQEARGLASYRDRIKENIKNSKIGVAVIKVVEPIKNAIDDVTSYTKQKIKQMFGWFGKMLKNTITMTLKGIGSVITSPFKAVASFASGGVAVKNMIVGTKDTKDYRVRNQSKFDDIMSGNRGFFQSLGDLAGSYNPFSAGRHDAKVGPDGAPYQHERQQARFKRREERNAKKAQRNEILDKMKNQSNVNKEIAKALGYDTVDKEGKRSDGIYKDIEKQMKTLYGKDWNKLDVKDKDRFKNEQLAKLTNNAIKDNTASTVQNLMQLKDYLHDVFKKGGLLASRIIETADGTDDLLGDTGLISAIDNAPIDSSITNPIPLGGFMDSSITSPTALGDSKESSDNNVSSPVDQSGTSSGKNNSADQLKAVMDAEDKEDAKDKLNADNKQKLKDNQFKVSQKTASNVKATKELEKQKKNELSWKDRIHDLIHKGNEDRVGQNKLWSSIFSKKGLIGAALLIALPFIIKFFKDPVGMLAGLAGKVGSAVLELLRDFLGIDDPDRDRTDASGNVVANWDAQEALTRGTAKVGIVATSKLVNAGKPIAAAGSGLVKGTQNLYNRITGKPIADVADNIVANVGDDVAGGVAGGAGSSIAANNADDLARAAGRNLPGSQGPTPRANLGAPASSGPRVNVNSNVIDMKYDPKSDMYINDNKEFQNRTRDKISSELDGKHKNNLQKFVDFGKESLSKAGEWLKKSVPGINNATVQKFISGLTKLLDVKKLAKMSASIMKKIGAGIAKILTPGVSDFIFGTYGAISGSTAGEAANMFRIKKSDVTPGIRMASGVAKAFLSLGYFFVIDILNDIAITLTGYDFVGSIVMGIYTAFAGEDAAEELTVKQEAFNTDYEQYAELNASMDPVISKAKEDAAAMKAQLDSDVTLQFNDEFMAKYEKTQEMANTVISKDAYNDKVNGSMFQSIRGGLDTTKKFLFGNKGNENKLKEAEDTRIKLAEMEKNDASLSSNKAFIQMKEDNEKALKKNTEASGVFTPAMDMMSSLKTKLFGGTKEKEMEDGTTALEEVEGILTPVFIKIGEFATNFGKGVSKLWSTLKSGLGKFVETISPVIKSIVELSGFAAQVVGNSLAMSFDDDDSNAEEITVSKSDPLYEFKIGVYYAARIVSFVPYVVLRTLKLVSGPLIKIGKSVFNILGGLATELATDVSEAIMGTITFESFLSPSFSIDSSPESAIKTALFIGSRILTAAPIGALTMVSAVVRNLGPIFKGIIQVVMGIVDDTVSGVSMAVKGEMFSSGTYWSEPATDGGPAGMIRTGLFYVQRILGFVPLAIVNTVSKVVSGVQNIWDSFRAMQKAGAEDINDLTVQAMKGEIDWKEYFSYTEEDGEPSSGSAKMLFYSRRISMFPSLAIINSVGWVVSGLQTIWEDIKKRVDKVVPLDYFTQASEGNIDWKEYFTFKGDGGPTESTDRLRFMTSRFLISIPLMVVQAVGGVGRTISKLWKGMENIGSDIKTFSDVDNVKPGDYWKMPGKTDGPDGMIKSVMFYITRGVLSIPYYFRQGLGAIVDKFKDLGSWLADKFNLTKYWKMPGEPEDEKNAGGEYSPGPISSRDLAISEKEEGIGGPAQSSMLKKYKVTSPYGVKRNISGKVGVHKGIDLSIGVDSPIGSFTDGKVTKVVNRFAPNSGYAKSPDGFGNHAIVQADDGKYSVYGHLNSVKVKANDTVKAGDILGTQGHTGTSTGSHLHYETRNSTSSDSHFNPVSYLENYKSTGTFSSSTGSPIKFDDISNVDAEVDRPKFTGLTGAVASLGEILSSAMSPLATAAADLSGLMTGITSATQDEKDNPGMSDATSADPSLYSGTRIGDSVKSFESGSKGSSTISSGVGDHGGVSFGTYQFPTRGKSKVASNTNLAVFWNKFGYAAKYPNVTPGNNQPFKDAWTAAVNADPVKFANAEWTFIKPQYYDIQKKKLDGVLNPDTHSRAAQDMVWSTSVQYGPYTELIRNALGKKDSQNLDAATLVDKVQTYKHNTIESYFPGSSANVRKGVKNRTLEEKKILQAIATQKPLPSVLPTGGAGGGIGGDDRYDISEYENAKKTDLYRTDYHGIGGESKKVKRSTDFSSKLLEKYAAPKSSVTRKATAKKDKMTLAEIDAGVRKVQDNMKLSNVFAPDKATKEKKTYSDSKSRKLYVDTKTGVVLTPVDGPKELYGLLPPGTDGTKLLNSLKDTNSNKNFGVIPSLEGPNELYGLAAKELYASPSGTDGARILDSIKNAYTKSSITSDINDTLTPSNFITGKTSEDSNNIQSSNNDTSGTETSYADVNYGVMESPSSADYSTDTSQQFDTSSNSGSFPTLANTQSANILQIDQGSGYSSGSTPLTDSTFENSTVVQTKLTEAMIELLNIIAENTKGTKENLDEIKKIPNNLNSVTNTGTDPSINVNSVNNSTNPMFDIASKHRDEKLNAEYAAAKSIARGM